MTTGRLDPTLYLIADAGVCGPSAMPGIVAAAAANGTTMVQLRDKEGSTGRLVDTARELREVLITAKTTIQQILSEDAVPAEQEVPHVRAVN